MRPRQGLTPCADSINAASTRSRIMRRGVQRVRHRAPIHGRTANHGTRQQRLANDTLACRHRETVRQRAPAPKSPADKPQVMNPWPVFQTFKGRLVLLGFGSIGQAVLPLLLRHIGMAPGQITVVKASARDTIRIHERGLDLRVVPLTPHNVSAVLDPLLGPGDFLINLSVDVSSVALMGLCQRRGALYLDTCIEPWAGGYIDEQLTLEERTNHALREQALALRSSKPQPTAVLTHGANPGLVSHWVKQALLDLAQVCLPSHERPLDREGWASLAQRLGVRVIHIAERDTQISPRRKRPGEFINTWSVAGFLSEAGQPAELGWGTHEKHWPADACRHATGSPAAIYLHRPGATTRVRSWTPLAGPQQAFLVTHGESISIADYLTLGHPHQPRYRPTVHYAYHPCDDAVLSLHEWVGNNGMDQPGRRILRDDISEGHDALGVLLMGHARSSYWLGSLLSIDAARALCPDNSATSLQVAAGVLAGVAWAIRNPLRGVVEPDDLPFDEVLAMCRPYLGDVRGVFSDWHPLVAHAHPMFNTPQDHSDRWQFINFRMS
jgi:homospermidine synthase